MEEGISREEYTHGQERIHERIDSMDKTTTRIEISAQLMKESVDKMCDCVYGNSKDGLLSKITKLFERVSLHTKLIMSIMFSILAIAFYIIKQSLLK